MNLPELVARNRSEYVHMAVELSRDSQLYGRVQAMVRERSHLVWEDMEVPFRWTQLFCGVSGLPVEAWGAFIAGTGRDVDRETALFQLRRRNREMFRVAWGDESWMLDGDGHASLETTFGTFGSNVTVPKVFSDWARQGAASDADAVPESRADGMAGAWSLDEAR